MGFDRKIKLAWLDAVAWQANSMNELKGIRHFLEEYLKSEIKGSKVRKHTITVLTKIWVRVDENHVDLQRQALEMLPTCDQATRCCLHWGMTLLAYPFFRDIAFAVGKLQSLQNTVSQKQIARRAVERWGDIEAVRISCSRAIRSMVEWGLLLDTEELGLYSPAPKLKLPQQAQLWLLEALFKSEEASLMTVAQLMKLPSAFPFEIDLSYTQLRKSGRFEVQRSQFDYDMVAIMN